VDTAPIKWEPIARRKRRGDNSITLKAVRPNVGTEVAYRACLVTLLRQMHDSMLVHIAAAWKDATPSIGVLATDDANPAIVLKRALTKWGRNWVSKFDAMSADLARRFASRNFRATDQSMASALKAAGFTVKFKPTPASVEAYQTVIANNVAQIKSIAPKFLKDVQDSVWSSVMRGGDLATLSKDLQKNYGVSYRRAAIIARTENGRAKAVMESVRRKELGIDYAVWLHSYGGKVPRPTHVAMNGKKFEVSKGIYDSAEGRNVFPGELISCRCVSKAVIEGFND
jgi:SPP1 gp7 family putative phage head morphogenesis protein